MKCNRARKILLIVPLYKNAHLIPGLIESIAFAERECALLDTKVIFINDSPDDEDLKIALNLNIQKLPRIFNCSIIKNTENMGFVSSANKGLDLALSDGRDAILLNSDCLLTPGAILEMVEVANADPLIGFVSPRSNNATICNSPYPDRYRKLDFMAAVSAHRHIEKFLPRFTYGPTAVGFCLYIRHLMLLEFGIFDCVYGAGYNEENDLISRCNQKGYRSVLANFAFVYHIGEVSFSLCELGRNKLEDDHRKILLKRYPEYERSVSRYFKSDEFKAQEILSGLVPDNCGRLKFLFDCSNLGSHHNGTFQFIKFILNEFVNIFTDKYVFYIYCCEEPLIYHGLDKVKNLIHIGRTDSLKEIAPFAIAIRLAQPFSKNDLTFISQLAPITGFVMLDTIALDCQQLDTFGLEQVWNLMLQTSEFLGYNSQFSHDQFHHRFTVPEEIVEFFAFHSTDPGDYILKQKVFLSRNEVPSVSLETQRSNGYVLIVGNKFSHKHVLTTLSLFKKMNGAARVIVLGVKVGPEFSCVSYESGELSDEVVDALYASADCIIFPSHYEGFGFPIMHALKHCKPVIARNLPSAIEIRQSVSFPDNVYLFETTAEMVKFSSSQPKWKAGSVDILAHVHSWKSCAFAMEKGLSRAIEKFDFSKLRRRLGIVRLIENEFEGGQRPKIGNRISLKQKLNAFWRHPLKPSKRRQFREMH